MPKILIIENEEIMIDLLQKKLLKEGYKVVVAREGEEGIRTMREEWPDLVLLDVDMPQGEGIKVMEEISQDPSLKAIPVIVLSNSDQSFELRKARTLGAADWIIKTESDPLQLIEKVRRQIGR
jgi:CheY-like chemotaxis protein